jgi:hypothetical protein
MKKTLLVVIAILLIFFGLRWISASFLSHKQCRCIQTGFLSDDYFSAITTNVNQLINDDYSAQTIISYLKKEYPILDKIIVAYRPCGIYVMMYAHKPKCCINDNLVLTSHNELFERNIFASNSLDGITQIDIAQEYIPKTAQLIPSLLQELPTDFSDAYTLELFNEHYVRLTDTQEKHFTIVSSIEQKKLSSLLAHCASVKKNINERKGFDKGISWVADIRFADYIVLYPMPRSITHGSEGRLT